MEYFELFTKKKSEYLEKCFASENKPLKYSMLQQLLGKNNAVLPQSLGEPECLAKNFNAFFVKKIEAVLVSLPLTNGLELNDSHTTTRDNFQVSTLSYFHLLLPKITNSTVPSDVFPTRLSKIVLTNSPDYFITLINLTLQKGYFPNQFKQGVMMPLLKKSNLDSELLSSYRPVTNLRFLSKVIEGVVFEQISFYLESYNLMSKYQSAFRCSHSTETALLKVFNDLCYLDESRSMMYIRLDLSAAFDKIDHQFLIEILAKSIGLQLLVLLFIKN